VSDYFNRGGSTRQVLLWTVAARVQLERWEGLLSDWIGRELIEQPFPDRDIWRTQYEWHFCLIAARNLLGALDLLDPPEPVDQTLRDEIIEVRDLNEHWKENMPVFNVKPQQLTPSRKSGKAFLARNPKDGPYGWFNWTSNRGPELTPNVPAAALRELLDRVQARVLNESPDMARFIPPPAEPPWVDDPGRVGWWPRQRPRQPN
jgi:hypothetical protein